MSRYIAHIGNDTLLTSGYKYNIWLDGSSRGQFSLRACCSGLCTSVPQLKGRSHSSTGAVAEMSVLYPPIFIGRDKPVSQKQHIWSQISMDNLGFVQLFYHVQKIVNNQEDDFLCDQLTVTKNILKQE